MDIIIPPQKVTIPDYPIPTPPYDDTALVARIDALEKRVEALEKPPVVVTPPPPTQPPSASTDIFAPGSMWRRKATNDAVRTNSPALVKELKDFYINRKVWLTGASYGTGLYTVDSTTPKVPLEIVSYDYVKNAKGKWVPSGVAAVNTRAGTALRAELLQGYRIPTNAFAASGRDGHIFIRDVSEDTGLEIWQLMNFGGKFYGAWGAKLKNLSQHPGFIPKLPSGERQGARASGLALWGGVITLAELESGVIPHPIAFSVPYPSSKFVAPAVNSDGYSSKQSWMPAWMWATPGLAEGLKVRAKSSLVFQANTCGMVKMVAKAFTDYGGYIVDKSDDRIGLYLESRAKYGQNDIQAYGKFLGKKADGSQKQIYDIYDQWAPLFDALEAVA